MNVSTKGHVWVTGASSGIGYAITKLLLVKGYKVIATARQVDELNKLAIDYPCLMVLQADLTLQDDHKQIIKCLEEHCIKLDILIVNAGTCEYMNNSTFDMNSMKRVFDINVFAAAQTIDTAQRFMNTNENPHIIGVSSMSVLLPFTRAEYYGASKAAFTYYIESLAIDLKPQNIDVSVVFPGFVDTPLTQKNNFSMPFMVSPNVAANELYKVIKKRPKEYAFPKKMSILLKAMGIVPGLWSSFHKPDMRPAQ